MIDDNEINKSKYKIEYLGEKLSKDLKFHKIIFIGGYGVGKAAIINKLMNKEINKEYALI